MHDLRLALFRAIRFLFGVSLRSTSRLHQLGDLGVMRLCGVTQHRRVVDVGLGGGRRRRVISSCSG